MGVRAFFRDSTLAQRQRLRDALFACTPADVERVARTYLVKGGETVAVAGSKDSIPDEIANEMLADKGLWTVTPLNM